jgi:hypothetical protein
MTKFHKINSHNSFPLCYKSVPLYRRRPNNRRKNSLRGESGKISTKELDPETDFNSKEEMLTYLGNVGDKGGFDSLRRVHTPPPWGGTKGLDPESNTLQEQHTPSACGGVVDSYIEFNTIPEQDRIILAASESIGKSFNGYQLISNSCGTIARDVLTTPGSGINGHSPSGLAFIAWNNTPKGIGAMLWISNSIASKHRIQK